MTSHETQELALFIPYYFLTKMNLSLETNKILLFRALLPPIQCWVTTQVYSLLSATLYGGGRGAVNSCTGWGRI